MPHEEFLKLSKDEFSCSAADRLRGFIVSGRLKPGERLIERDLAERLGISRTPVREALTNLQREGLVSDAGQRGVRVSKLSCDEIVSIYQVIGGLERTALRTTLKVTPAMRTALRKSTERRLRAGRDIERLIEADLAWHQALTAFTSNIVVHRLLQAPQLMAQRYERAFFGEESNRYRSTKEHDQIQGYIEAGDLHTAANLVESHWLDNIDPMVSAVRASQTDTEM